MGFVDKIKNAYTAFTQTPFGDIRKQNAKNLSRYITPVQFERLKQDILSWRDSFKEAENAWYPHRVKQQRVYNDTIINGQVHAAMERRKNLTKLKEFGFYNGETLDEKTTDLFKAQWFNELTNYVLDAQAFGYSLISLGDITENTFKQLELIKRWNVSPDRENVVPFTYSISGVNFNDPNDKDESGNSFYDWSIWVKTPNEIGGSNCGYGYLARVALYEIYVRNNLGYNAKFVELFAQPFRVGKTTKMDEDGRTDMVSALQDMGSNGWAVIDPSDEIEFIETALGGTGYKSYDNLESRSLKMISKIILGHADALDSTEGKLGSGNGTEAAPSPVAKALQDIEVTDNRFFEFVMNDQIIPKLIKIGFPIKAGLKFKFKNDKEKQEIRKKQDESNQITATIAKTMSDAGIKMNPEYFTERTGIPCKEVEAPIPVVPVDKSVSEKLKNLYADKNIK